MRLLAMALLAGLLLAGCGGGGGSGEPAAPASGSDGSNPSADMGDVLISLTDAEGDFVTYGVDVVSLTLERANGDVVSALPAATRVDFTELVDVSEFVSLATVPAGVYRSVTMRLDYSNADVVVQNAAGDGVPATLEDADGAPLGTVDVAVQLPGDRPVRVNRGTTALLALDFDLDATNTVTSFDPAVVVVEPVLLATAELDEQREHRIRGLLAQVSTADQVVVVDVRPFKRRDGRFGSIRMHVDDATEYEIDGRMLSGSDGLDALAQLNAGVPVKASGRVVDGGFVAETVIAGDAVIDMSGEFASGTVAARDGNVITLRGGHVSPADGTATFRDTFDLLVGENTRVMAARRGEVGIDAISVGQHVLARGSFDGSVFDARSGAVRLPFTGLVGEVVSTTPLVVDLAFIDGRRAERLDFSGTGTTPETDADPAAYEIESTNLVPGSLEPGDVMRARGLVTAFGMAPPDFEAVSVIDLQTDSRAAHVGVRWPDDAGARIVGTAPGRIDVDTTGAELVIHLRGVPRPLGAEGLSAFVAPDDDQGRFALRLAGERAIRVFDRFSTFVQALDDELSAGNDLVRASAAGRYNAGEATLTTRRASFVMGSHG